MDTRTSSPLACRYCHHYQIQGRRGGHCHKLGAPVKGEWNSCSLMRLSFSVNSTKKSYGMKIRSDQYVSEIYSYDSAAKLKSSASLKRAKQIKEAKAS